MLLSYLHRLLGKVQGGRTGISPGKVWYGIPYMVWYVTVRYGMVRYGIVWYGMVWYVTVR